MAPQDAERQKKRLYYSASLIRWPYTSLSKLDLHWISSNLSQVILTKCSFIFSHKKNSCTPSLKILSSNARGFPRASMVVPVIWNRWQRREMMEAWRQEAVATKWRVFGPTLLMALSRSVTVSLGIMVFRMWEHPVSAPTLHFTADAGWTVFTQNL